ncbi:FUSC family protein [Ectopseudomonas mendocina]|uniref:FUSC family protein n=1 Tax=Ectopseudomonas mendocina TaxID=300 RepID=A0ABZ2RRW4_ECTME
MPNFLKPFLSPSLRAVQFAIKTVLGAFLALWCALRFGLDQPQWAMMTAVIVAQPLSGMVVQKAIARLLGTLVGATMSIVVMALFSQAPWMFLAAVALWLGLCTAASTMMRSAWAYAFVLAGYTVGIICLPSLGNPLNVFEEAVARATEISLGIICASVVQIILWPVRVNHQLVGQAQETWRAGLQAAQQSLSGESLPRQGLLGMLGRIVAVDAQREHAWFEGYQGRLRAQAVRLMSRDLLAMLRLARGVARQWRQLTANEAVEVSSWLTRVRDGLDSPEATDWSDLHDQLVEALSAQQWSASQQHCLDRLALFIRTLIAAKRSLDAVCHAQPIRELPPALSWHHDWQTAAFFGARSALAFLLVACFWMATAWPSATGAMVLCAVVCSLFASRDNAIQLGVMFLRGTIWAIPVAFVVAQLLIPIVYDFELLSLVLGVPMFVGALAMGSPATGAVATAFCMHLVVLSLAPAGVTNDVPFFINDALGLVIGVSCAVLAFKLISLRNRNWLGRRLLQATARDMGRLARLSLVGAENWFGGRMADRLVQLARYYPVGSGQSQGVWEEGVAALDLGDELLQLRSCIQEIPGLASDWNQFVVRYEAVINYGPKLDRQEALDPAINNLSEVLMALPSSSDRRLAQSALVQLRSGWRHWCAMHGDVYGAA